MCLWVPSVRWARDTSKVLPPNCRHGKSPWQHTERFAGVNTINHVLDKGMARSILARHLSFSQRHVLLFRGHLLTYLTDICSPSPYLEGPWDSGMSQSVGARVFPWVSLPLSWHRRVTLASQSGSHSSCSFLFVLDPFPEVQDASNMCPQGSASLRPILWPSENGHPPRLCPPPCISLLQLLEITGRQEKRLLSRLGASSY